LANARPPLLLRSGFVARVPASSLFVIPVALIELARSGDLLHAVLSV